MGKKLLTDLPNDQRCTKHSKKWRCPLPRHSNKSYCYKHYHSNSKIYHSKSKSKSTQNSANASSSCQIWAFHQNFIDHPNLYARVESVKKSKKSSIQVTPLVPLSTNVGCGLFRVSNSEATMEMGRFSHRVCFAMVADDLYEILPQKGEVWAVDVCGFVEIVSSFDDNQEAIGLLLGQGQEWFQKKLHDGRYRKFQKDEIGMFRYLASAANDAWSGRAGFSKHQVASRTLSNELGTQKAPNHAGNSQPPGATNGSTQPSRNLHVLPGTSNEHQVASQTISNELGRQKAPSCPQKRKTNNERHSLAGAGTLWKNGTRRSARHRFRPLEYWRGERLLYGCIHGSFPTVIGVKYASPGEESLKVESYVSDEFADLVNLAAKG